MTAYLDSFGPLAASWAGLALVIFGILVAMLWFFLPFAVFGVKALLQQIIDNQNTIITELRESRHVANGNANSRAYSGHGPSSSTVDRDPMGRIPPTL